jgi:hypothetical protein
MNGTGRRRPVLSYAAKSGVLGENGGGYRNIVFSLTIIGRKGKII